MRTEVDKIEEITKWKTSDGEEFYSLDSAQHHAQNMDAAAVANAALEDGASVAIALSIAGYVHELDPILSRVTKDTKLVIEYWQCRDTPGYQPRHFLPGLYEMYVGGDAGSWSGSYGGDVKLSDLVRYAKHENTTGLLPCQ